jgi:hypothetical protein
MEELGAEGMEETVVVAAVTAVTAEDCVLVVGIRTVHRVLCESFQAAAIALNLVKNNKQLQLGGVYERSK